MRLATIFLIATMLQVSAATMAQQVTLKKSEITLRQLFKEVRKQTGYSVIWGSEEFNANEKISVDFNHSSLQEVLNKVVVGKEFSYLIDEKTIIIQTQTNKVSDASILSKATIEVSGKVVDQNGTPLSGASIVLKSNGKGISTAADGTFTIVGIEEGAILVVKFIGFDALEVKAAKNLGTIRMTPATSDLDEVQVQAYGTSSRRLSTSNITTIRSQDIEKQPVSNPLLALQGRVPGLIVTPVTGFAGANVTVRIQGYNSIVGGNSPFYVVDGVPYNSFLAQPNAYMENVWGTPERLSQVTQRTLISQESTGSPLNYINPADIESIEILKDADATAIYGSKAANGAIIITTKKGKAGPLKIDGSVMSGFNKITNVMQQLSVEEYIQARLEAKKNDNAPILATDYDLNGFWGNKQNTDLQKYFLGKSTANHNAQLSATGGNSNTNYRINLGYQHQNSLFGNNLNDEKVSLGLNLNSSSSNQRFKIVFSLTGMIDNNKLPGANPITTLLQMAPNSPSIYNADGTLNWAINGSGVQTWDNPLAKLETKINSKANNLTTNLTLSYDILSNFQFKTNLGYNRAEMDNLQTTPATATAPLLRSNLSRYSTRSVSKGTGYIVEPQLSYKRRLGSYFIDALVGTTIQQNTSTGYGVNWYGIPSDNQLENIAVATNVESNGSVDRNYRYNAGFVRLSLNRNDELLLNLTARRDGSSRFGPNNRFQNFGAIGAGWVFTEREWVKKNVGILSFGKLRLSYGVTGNDQIGDYSYMDLYRIQQTNIAYQNVSLLNIAGIYNPDLQWERTRKLNVGLDLAFFKDGISFTGNYAVNRSDNLLQLASLPSFVSVPGGVTMWINFPGEIENRSLELSLTSWNFRNKNFSWRTAVNFTHSSNELLSLGDPKLLFGVTSRLRVGHSIRSQPIGEFVGVDPLTGTNRTVDINGNPVGRGLDPQDYTKFVDLLPSYTAGMANTLSYHGISLDFFFQFQKQLGQRLVPRQNFGSVIQNGPNYLQDRWTKPGDVSLYQRYGTVLTGSAIDRQFEDASFIRLKNVAVNWSVPQKWLDVLRVKQLRISAQMQNLWTITGYSGLDPETGSDVLPAPRTIVFGLNIGF